MYRVLYLQVHLFSRLLLYTQRQGVKTFDVLLHNFLLVRRIMVLIKNYASENILVAQNMFSLMLYIFDHLHLYYHCHTKICIHKNLVMPLLFNQ